MSNNESKSADEAVARMAALINHLGVEFNSFLKHLTEQGYKLTPPNPPPVLDTVLLDHELGFKDATTGLDIRDVRPGSPLEAAILEGRRAAAAVKETPGDQPAKADTAAVSATNLAKLYSQAALELKAVSNAAMPGSLESQIEKMRDAQLIDPVVFRMQQTPADKLDTMLSEAEVGSHTLAAIRGDSGKKMGDWYREAIDDTAKVVNVDFGNATDVKVYREGDPAPVPSPEDEVMRNSDGTETILSISVTDMSSILQQPVLEPAADPVADALSAVEVSKASPVSDIAAALMLDTMGNNTIGDSPDYPLEAATPVGADMVTADEAKAPNKFKYYEQMAFRDVRGMFRHFFNTDVIEGGRGNIGTEKTDRFVSAQRYREDVLRTGAARTAAFPIGMYRDQETGGYQLYIPTDFPRASVTKINLLVTGLETDNYRVFYTKYDDQKVPVFEELDPKDEHAETIFLIFMETLRAHQLFNTQFKV